MLRTKNQCYMLHRAVMLEWAGFYSESEMPNWLIKLFSTPTLQTLARYTSTILQYFRFTELTWLLSTESIHGLSRNPNVGITPFFPLLPQNALLQANANQAGISMHIFQSLKKRGSTTLVDYGVIWLWKLLFLLEKAIQGQRSKLC